MPLDHCKPHIPHLLPAKGPFARSRPRRRYRPRLAEAHLVGWATAPMSWLLRQQLGSAGYETLPADAAAARHSDHAAAAPASRPPHAAVDIPHEREQAVSTGLLAHAFHDAQRVLAEVGGSMEGLTAADVAARRKRWGLNVVAAPHVTPAYRCAPFLPAGLRVPGHSRRRMSCVQRSIAPAEHALLPLQPNPGCCGTHWHTCACCPCGLLGRAAAAARLAQPVRCCLRMGCCPPPPAAFHGTPPLDLHRPRCRSPSTQSCWRWRAPLP